MFQAGQLASTQIFLEQGYSMQCEQRDQSSDETSAYVIRARKGRSEVVERLFTTKWPQWRKKNKK